MKSYAHLSVESLEDRCTPVVHSFTPAAGLVDAAAAGGTAANQVVIGALGGIPAPVVASGDHSQGVPFIVNHVPANPRGNLLGG